MTPDRIEIRKSTSLQMKRTGLCAGTLLHRRAFRLNTAAGHRLIPWADDAAGLWDGAADRKVLEDFVLVRTAKTEYIPSHSKELRNRSSYFVAPNSREEMFMIWEFIVAVVVAFVGGAAGGRHHQRHNERKMHKLKRQDAKEDNEALDTENRLKRSRKDDAQSEALKFILYDRIGISGRPTSQKGEIDSTTDAF